MEDTKKEAEIQLKTFDIIYRDTSNLTMLGHLKVDPKIKRAIWKYEDIAIDDLTIKINTKVTKGTADFKRIKISKEDKQLLTPLISEVHDPENKVLTAYYRVDPNNKWNTKDDPYAKYNEALQRYGQAFKMYGYTLDNKMIWVDPNNPSSFEVKDFDEKAANGL